MKISIKLILIIMSLTFLKSAFAWPDMYVFQSINPHQSHIIQKTRFLLIGNQWFVSTAPLEQYIFKINKNIITSKNFRPLDKTPNIQIDPKTMIFLRNPVEDGDNLTYTLPQ